jgi:hypothetical protein
MSDETSQKAFILRFKKNPPTLLTRLGVIVIIQPF